MARNLFSYEGKRVLVTGGGRGIGAAICGKPYAPRPDGRYRFGDTRHVFSDCTALRSLGWEPKRDAVASVSDYLVWLRDQDDLSGVLDRAEQQMRGLGVVREVMS